MSGRKLSNFVLLTLVIVSVTTITINPTHAQRGDSADNPFVVVFTMAGVDNSTDFVANWVTVNNVTRGTYSNLSEIDLMDTHPNDGFVETSVLLPNGTLQIGDEYTACSVILKDAYLTCEKGFNAPTNRAEFVDVSITPSQRRQ
jgi:hypothetical protein